MKFLTIEVFILFLCIDCVFAQDHKKFDAGVLKFRDGDYKTVIDVFSELLSSPTHDTRFDSDIYFYRGQAYYYQNEYYKSLSDLDQSLTLNNYNKGIIYWFKARCFGKLKNREEAILSYQLAMTAAESNERLTMQILNDRAQFHILNSDSTSAKKDLQLAEFLSRVRRGNDYSFKLKSGYEMEIYVQQVGPESVSGYSYQYDSVGRLTRLEYEESFVTIEKNVLKITLLKRKPVALDLDDANEIRPELNEPVYISEELENKIRKSQKMKEAGTTLTVLGGLAVAGGVIAMMVKSTSDLMSDNGTDTHTEEAIIGIGMIVAAPGIPLLCIGIRNERKYKEESKEKLVSLGLNMKRPGLSLTFRF